MKKDYTRTHGYMENMDGCGMRVCTVTVPSIYNNRSLFSLRWRFHLFRPEVELHVA